MLVFPFPASTCHEFSELCVFNELKVCQAMVVFRFLHLHECELCYNELKVWQAMLVFRLLDLHECELCVIMN